MMQFECRLNLHVMKQQRFIRYLTLIMYFSGSEYAGCVMNLNQMKKVKEVGQSDHSENDHGSLGQGEIYLKSQTACKH